VLWSGRVERGARCIRTRMNVVAPLVVEVDERACDGCRTCMRACRYGALLWVHGEQAVWVDPWQCSGCGACETACPLGALKLVARRNGGT
jgi:NAD-dependent dihydropyrimidine dehydrogenase PreA subunit